MWNPCVQGLSWTEGGEGLKSQQCLLRSDQVQLHQLPAPVSNTRWDINCWVKDVGLELNLDTAFSGWLEKNLMKSQTWYRTTVTWKHTLKIAQLHLCHRSLLCLLTLSSVATHNSHVPQGWMFKDCPLLTVPGLRLFTPQNLALETAFYEIQQRRTGSYQTFPPISHWFWHYILYWLL